MEELYDEISRELTEFESGDGEKLSEKEWLDVFYRLLCRIQGAIADANATLNDCRNELCLRCGEYKYRHNGACRYCRWRAMQNG